MSTQALMRILVSPTASPSSGPGGRRAANQCPGTAWPRAVCSRADRGVVEQAAPRPSTHRLAIPHSR